MFTEKLGYFLVAETPLHVGSGTSLDVVDMPIQRDYAQLPIIPGQGIKGTVRHYLKETNFDYIDEIFGPDNTEYSSCITFSQANLLLFPVASFKGTFGFVTCPNAIQNFIKNMKKTGYEPRNLESINNLNVNDDSKCFVTNTSQLIVNNKVVLYDFCFAVENRSEVTNISDGLSRMIFSSNDSTYDYLKNKVKNDLIIVTDTVFQKLTLLKTEVVYRNKINEKGVVEEGALWTEEYLPSDSILYGWIFIGNSLGNPQLSANNISSKIKQNLKSLFIGGNKTVGKGLVSFHFINK